MTYFITQYRMYWIVFKAEAEVYFRRGHYYEETYMEMNYTYEGICPQKNSIYFKRKIAFLCLET